LFGYYFPGQFVIEEFFGTLGTDAALLGDIQLMAKSSPAIGAAGDSLSNAAFVDGTTDADIHSSAPYRRVREKEKTYQGREALMRFSSSARPTASCKS
jgi:hypothetical protein